MNFKNGKYQFYRMYFIMEEPRNISHLKKNCQNLESWDFQSNEDHQKGVADLAEKFASTFGCGKLGLLMGLLHDKGKEQQAFQQYIRKISGYMPQIKYAPKTPHAYVGAILAKKLYPHLYPILSYPIASHHAGLYDSYDFEDIMKKEQPNDINQVTAEFSERELFPTIPMQSNDVNHFIRILFSCLVDADYLDTERFMNEGNYLERSKHASLSQLLPKLEEFLTNLSKDAPKTELNTLRASIQKVCAEKSSLAPGFYSLTVPTGGGKTLSSLLWAIKHALKYGKDRIIIAIPYTSIIVQTAATLRHIFGDENVCEHHSTFDPELVWKGKKNISQLELQQRLATENWDYPIIVTTNVQLFESMFSNKPSACRKLHNIVNSVLILDEVQTLPHEYLQPIVNAMDTYKRLFGTSFLFTTASQPVLKGEHRGSNPSVIFHGLKDITEIIPSNWNLHDRLRRVNLCFDQHRSSYDDITSRLSQYNRVLCIVNTRNDAAEIFKRLPSEGYTFHLSRRMCPLHIQQTIEQIRKLLKDSDATCIRVVSTQLVEAGVDIDFPVVFRQEAGLDSILQAAGRCNREGKLGISNAYVFNLEKPVPKGTLSFANDARKSLQNVDDWFAPATMSQYFLQLYARCEDFDLKQIVSLLRQSSRRNEIEFQQASNAFKLIENKGRNIVVNYQDSLELIEKIKNTGFSYELSKKLGKFIVNINDNDFKSLVKEGFIQEVIEGLYLLPDREQYDLKTGLTTQNHWMDEILIQ